VNFDADATAKMQQACEIFVKRSARLLPTRSLLAESIYAADNGLCSRETRTQDFQIPITGSFYSRGMKKWSF
jgi:hypothetical protein